MNDQNKTKYGRLTVLSVELRQHPNKPSERRSWAHCRCDCGLIHDAWLNSLRSGNTTSCGCYRGEISVKRLTSLNSAGKGARRGHYEPRKAGEDAAVADLGAAGAISTSPKPIQPRQGDSRRLSRSFSESDILDMISGKLKIA